MSAQELGSRAILGELFMRLEMGAVGWHSDLVFPITSDQASEEHRWIGMSPQMRKWIGGRLIHGQRGFGVRIDNEPYEASIEVLIDELRRDKTAQVMARIADLAERTNSHGAKLLSELIINGESTPCYDGQFFFDTDHTEGSSGTQSNDTTVDISALPVGQHGSTTDPSIEEMVRVILKGVQDMFGFKDDQGEPINERASDFIVMTPTSLWAPSANAVSLNNLSGGANNPLANVRANGRQLNFEVVANPRLTWTDKIAIFRRDMSDGVKAFIRQEEVKVRVSAQAEGSAEEFNNRRHVYGVDWLGAYGYGFWQHATLLKLI